MKPEDEIQVAYRKSAVAAAAHTVAWVGMPISVGLYVLAAVSAAGAPGPNHSAGFWNVVLTVTPGTGVFAALAAMLLSRSWIGRITATLPMLGHLTALFLIISWHWTH